LVHRVTTFLIDGLALLLPDLARFTQTSWLVNGTGSAATLGMVAGQTLIYGAVLTGAGLFDLYRKNL
jgi:hypothetical protein